MRHPDCGSERSAPAPEDAAGRAKTGQSAQAPGRGMSDRAGLAGMIRAERDVRGQIE